MKNCSSIKAGLLIGTIILLISSIAAPMTIGYNVRKPDKATIAENYNCYHISEIPNLIEHRIYKESKTYNNIESEKISKPAETMQPLDDPPMDSPWPMYCHDVRHTGRSPYSTADNPGDEKWRFDTINVADGDIVIDDNGIIYIGSTALYAIYPNGTLKWKYDTGFHIDAAPAIEENGVIYCGTIYGNTYLFAIYTSNGTIKWKYFVGNSIFSAPAIGEDGTIYFGDANNHINALYPDGKVKWRFSTDHVVYSSPTIGDDGTVYCGCHDTYLYALYPNNGTLKWKYKTGHWIRVSPCIADDGTIYVVSLDNYLHAVNPDSTMKWKTDVGAGTSPTIGQDGTIYCGYKKLHAINPTDGSIKWSFDPGPDRQIRGGTPCHSSDDIIIFGTHIGETDGGELIAVNPDGTERWRIMIATCWVDSAPAIAEDGTIYVGSCNDGYHPGSAGYLHAVGELDPNAPSAPEIDGPKKIKPDVEYEYTFTATSPIGNDVYYWIEWGDNKGTGWIGPYNSGEKITVSHKWPLEGTTTIKARAKDTDNLWGPWGKFEIEITKSAPTAPEIEGPTHGKKGILYDYKFMSTHPYGDKIWYYVKWGDFTNTGWFGPHSSGTEVTKSHQWNIGRTFIISAKAKDTNEAESEWAEFKVTIPRNKAINNLLLLRFLERFPLLEVFLRIINP